MPRINIKLGNQISQTNDKTIKIQIKNTNFWIEGVQQQNKLWNVYIADPTTNRKDILKKNKTTSSFSMFSNIILKQPFPYKGKMTQNIEKVSQFIKQITKKTNATKHTRIKSLST